MPDGPSSLGGARLLNVVHWPTRVIGMDMDSAGCLDEDVLVGVTAKHHDHHVERCRSDAPDDDEVVVGWSTFL